MFAWQGFTLYRDYEAGVIKRMRVHRLCTITLAGLMLPSCGQASTVDPATQAVIDLTRNTRTSYTLYNWNIIAPEGETEFGEWSAEFHDGTRHRVETPRDRLVADCETMEGSYLKVVTNERFSGPSIARAACGIQANSEILSARTLGVKQTPFGSATMIEITDPENIRTYEVSDEGILLAATISDNAEPALLRLTGYAVAVEKAVPSKVMFSVTSLDTSFVPERYTHVPKSTQ